MPVAALLLLQLLASGLDDAPPANAADLYRQAIATWQTLAEEDRTIVAEAFGDAGPLVGGDPALAAALARVAPAIDLFMAASRIEACDWGLDRGEGFAMGLPHLGPMRAISRAAALAAVEGFVAGRCDAACDAIEAVSRSQRHLAADPLMVESLVSGSVLSIAGAAIDAAIDAGAIDAVSAARLGEAMPASAIEAMGAARTFRNEFEMLSQELRRMAAADAPDPDEIVSDHAAAAIRSFAEGDPAAFEGTIERVRGFSERAAEAMADPDAASRSGKLEAIDAEIEALRLEGPDAVGVVLSLLPSYAAFGESFARTERRLGGVRDRLAAITAGTDPASLANAAVPYLRAVAAIDATPPRLQIAIELLRQEPAAASDSMRREGEAWLDRLDEAALEPLRRAGRIARCDFDFGRADTAAPGEVLLRRAFPSLRGGARLLLAEARRRGVQLAESAAGDEAAPDEAAALREAIRADLLATTAMARHLGSDRTIGGTLVAASILEDLAAGIVAMRQDGMLDEATLEALRLSIAELPRGGREGPLGADAAMARTREAAAGAASADRAASFESAIFGLAIASEGPIGLRIVDDEWMLGADDLLDLAAWRRLAAHGDSLGDGREAGLDRVVRVGDPPSDGSGEAFAPVLPAERPSPAAIAIAAIGAIDAAIAAKTPAEPAPSRPAPTADSSHRE